MSQNGEGLPFEEPKSKFRPIRLRRTQHQNTDIEENLGTLSNSKKRWAQERYYGSTGQSPLTRSIATMLQERRPPVHERLGTHKIILRRTGRNVPNNNLMPINRTRMRLRRTNVATNNATNGLPISLRRNGFRRPQSVQQRLSRIRQPQLENAIHSPQLRTKLFRRRRPVLPNQPTNFTVQVTNPDFNKGPRAIFFHSVQGSLNCNLQTEINQLQNQSESRPQYIAAEPIYVSGHGATAIFINDRFSRLP